MSKRQYPSQRRKIIEAAENLLIEQGVGKFRTDALIEASGLSKGGFFYHFKSIEDLLYELGKKNGDEFYAEVQRVAEDDSNKVGRYTRAYLKICLLGDSAQRKRMTALSRVFLEIVVTNPQILKRIREDHKGNLLGVLKMLRNDDLPIHQVRMLQMAADGIWYNESLGLSDIKKKEREAMFEYLVPMTEKVLK